MLSPLQQERLHFQPQVPTLLRALQRVSLVKNEEASSSAPHEVASFFPKTANKMPLHCVLEGKGFPSRPLKVGVVLSGGQAPGGHNVISGLYDALQEWHHGSTLVGFCGGPKGIVDNVSIAIDAERIKPYRNQGGFDLLGSGRTKIETSAQFQAALNTANLHALDGLVIIGGDDSNTNAAHLAEYFSAHGSKTAVIGVPKTIDGDMKGGSIEISFGFDTASKTYSETIGSLMRDAISAKKHYYFVKMMGRSASHITLECALKTHPNLALIGEEIAAQSKTLAAVVQEIANMICERSARGLDYGVILIPEGIIEFIPEVNGLIAELNAALVPGSPHRIAIDALPSDDDKIHYIASRLSPAAASCFYTLPKETQGQLLLVRDAHGNVQVSKIETERMLIDLVKSELVKRASTGIYRGKFEPQPHFCGYEGRSCLPSNFDTHYCYALGRTAALLVANQSTGYICYVGNLAQPVATWTAGGIPLTHLMTLEQRHGKLQPVIKKALVNLQGGAFSLFAKERGTWAIADDFSNPGPIQFFGPKNIVDAITETLSIEAASLLTSAVGV